MNTPRRQRPKPRSHDAPARTPRAARPPHRRRAATVTGLAALAVIMLTGGLLAVHAGSSGRSNHVQLYQGGDVIGGQSVALSSLIGKGRPVMVNFWASNCPPCRMEMPGFQRVYDEHDGQGYVMLGIDVGPQTGLGTHEGARALLRQEAISYPVGYAEGDGLVLEYGLRGMPTTLFFDASGAQVARVVGFLPEAQLRARLANLLASR